MTCVLCFVARLLTESLPCALVCYIVLPCCHVVLFASCLVASRVLLLLLLVLLLVLVLVLLLSLVLYSCGMLCLGERPGGGRGPPVPKVLDAFSVRV